MGFIEDWQKFLHKYYAEDSVTSEGTGFGARVREALAHPERFYLLCRPCHGAFDTVKKVMGIDIVKLHREGVLDEPRA